MRKSNKNNKITKVPLLKKSEEKEPRMKFLKNMNFYLKGIILVETILIVFFLIEVTDLFDEEVVAVKKAPVASQITEKDFFNEMTSQDLTVEVTEQKEGREVGVQKSLSKGEFFLDSEDSGKIENPRILALLKKDPELKLLNYPSKAFSQSKLKDYLKAYYNSKVYVLLELKKNANFEFLYKLQNLKINKIHQLSVPDYLNKSEVFLYVPFYKLNRLVRNSFVENVYILSDYTGTGFYQLGMLTEVSTDNIQIDLRFPYSKHAHNIMEIDNQFSDKEINVLPQSPSELNPDNNLITIQASLSQDDPLYFTSQIKSKISLERLLENNVKIAAKDVTISEYKKLVQAENPELYKKFTQFTKRVVSSAYIDGIVEKFHKHNQKQIESGLEEKSIAAIWKKLTFILNRDIRYDWKKRKLFFSGNLPYNNIADMYLTAKELAETRVGACTERTSLEISVLRKLGIAARTATRLYHIYTEIYIPGKGWVSTSSTLNEIPLTHSYNEQMAYFVDWKPNHPIRLKWTGFVLPKVITESTDKKLAMGVIISAKNN